MNARIFFPNPKHDNTFNQSVISELDALKPIHADNLSSIPVVQIHAIYNIYSQCTIAHAHAYLSCLYKILLEKFVRGEIPLAASYFVSA